MSLLRLSLLVAVLATGVVLAVTNPSTDQYVHFIQAELTTAIDRMDQGAPDRGESVVRSILRRHSQELLTSMIRPHTVRHNFGLFSRFETVVLETRVVIIGVYGRFIPLEGVDEVRAAIGQRVP
ncbi:MAG: hypothetical protein JW388_0528 [Nitrospira sp.]|nr:hypothetical protein [Nitrospira sp.]